MADHVMASGLTIQRPPSIQPHAPGLLLSEENTTWESRAKKWQSQGQKIKWLKEDL